MAYRRHDDVTVSALSVGALRCANHVVLRGVATVPARHHISHTSQPSVKTTANSSSWNTNRLPMIAASSQG